MQQRGRTEHLTNINRKMIGDLKSAHVALLRTNRNTQFEGAFG